MSNSTEEKVMQTEHLPTIPEMHLFGEGEHAHGEPRARPDEAVVTAFLEKQNRATIFWDGHHIVQYWLPLDPNASRRERARWVFSLLRGHKPPARGHIQLLFKCGDTEHTVEWPAEEAHAYHAQFSRWHGYQTVKKPLLIPWWKHTHFRSWESRRDRPLDFACCPLVSPIQR
ncbi:uncharacterized protein BO97DRAFT_425153 [Aspergillus homomorphus CBS 101889]|uniref:Uncharacterized protein n=1 Tax=Aspergillus homomorphus (strain CBS 101889) TaxID=1450537 RepID=A0A395HWQ9_ASPHC|nr:hypothetical protein BO97DRAFT_425153 [Aspergillus homomorphus CBS 101889]RAL11853.1 hypothetical protein BO97DRAFT_425153 [Aspergillus homomorphus CBS 101889]